MFRVTTDELSNFITGALGVKVVPEINAVSVYGWKIVDIAGTKQISACSESEYREMCIASGTEDDMRSSGRGGCYSMGAVDCRSYGNCFCVAYLDHKRHRWYCVCT